MTKRVVRMVLCLLLIAATLAPARMDTGSYKHPQGLWQHLDRWNKAKEDNDYDTILELAPVIEALYKGEELNTMNSGMMSTVCLYAARGSQLKGDYDAAVSWLKKQLVYDNYLNNNGTDRVDSIILAEALISRLDITVDIYAAAKNPADVPYFGAVGEPKTGTLKGSVATRDKPGSGTISDGESAILLYVEFEPDSAHNMQYWVEYFSAAEKVQNALEGNAVIELAWNFKKEGAQLAEINNGSADDYIIESIKYLASLNTEVLLRVGAEMNVWTTLPDAEAYKSAFRRIADCAHKNANNIAVVFSPNDISSWGKTYMDYYPGDEYADWVGLSLYYTGAPSDGNYLHDAFYNRGEFSENPLATLRGLAETFPNKPIIISECGFAYYTDKSGDQTAQAVERLKKFYAFLPMIYPQVKAVLYFDNDVGGPNKYRFADNAAVKSAYLAAIDSDVYPDSRHSPAMGYTRLSTVNEPMNVLKLYTNALFPSAAAVSCTYYLDGKQVKTTTTPPFAYELDVGSLSRGTHTVKVAVTCGNISKTVERQFTVGAGNAVRGDSAAPAPVLTASPTSDSTSVNGNKISFFAYKIDGSNYVMLRDMAYTLSGTEKQFEVEYDSASSSILLTSGKPYTPVGGEMTGKGSGNKTPVPTSSRLFLDGKELALTAYNIEGNNYFKLREIGAALNFNVTWDGASSTIVINTAEGYTPD